MNEAWLESMERVVEQMYLDMKKRWWWWLLAPFLAVGYWMFQDWVVGMVKRLAAVVIPHWTVTAMQPRTWSSGFSRPLVIFVGLFLATILGFFIHAYFETRRSVAFTGTVDLLAIRMDTGDKIHLTADFSEYSMDVGAFCRMSITANDKPRTVKRFLMEVREMKDGVRVEPPVHVATSEYSIGDHLYRRKEHSTNSYGYAVVKDVFEPLPDLAEKLRTPLAPATHADGWVRFELQRVKYLLSNYHLIFYAVDANDRRFEIEARDVRFADPMDEYVVAKPR